MIKVGIIGGSGLNDPKFLEDFTEKEVTTKYGKPSSLLTCGKLNGVDVVILARHGREHTIPPTQVNFRANIQALKEAGCTHILATTACGSLREEIGRGHFVVLDQFIDFTRHRSISFYELFPPHTPTHAPMADPFDDMLRNALIEACKEVQVPLHKTGTVITIEGPRFSTRAESKMFQRWGADIINMSIAPEAILANEANIPYAAIAMSTDYDCWKEGETVTWEEVLKIFKQNVNKVKDILIKTLPKVQEHVH